MNVGVNSANIKEINRTLVLKLICTNQDVSRIWLANQTGLTRMTLSNIISGFTQSGVLCDVRDLATTNIVGRRPIKVDLAETSPLVMGINISRDWCAGLLMDLKARRVKKVTYRLGGEDTAQTLMSKILKTIERLQQATDRKILGVGVASVGPVDVRSGVLLKPTNFYGIADVPICEMITKKTGYPAFLRNMMNASALAEKYYGRGRDIEDFVYVGITNGVGAGIVSGGELFSSGSGFEGEFGHSSINYDGPKCSCGNRGCLELYATIPRIIETVNEECTANFTTIEEVSEFCRENAEARHAMYSIMDKLAIALASLVNIVDPVRVIIGDEGSGIGQSMIERLESEVNRRILARNEKHVEIVRSDFGAEVRLIGAATIVADQVFTAQMRIDE